MKRRIVAILLSAAMTGAFAVGTPAFAATDACTELGNAMRYHLEQGNYDYIETLSGWASQAGCDFI